jgi:integrase/recombinase XerD
MAKRKNPQAKALQIEISDPDSLIAYLARHLEWMAVRHYAETSISGRKHYIGLFIIWCKERDLRQPQEITRPILENYQRSLFRLKKTNGKPLSARSQANHISSLKGFFSWLSKSRYILYNPASELEAPRRQKRLPRYTLNEAEIEKVLSIPDLSDPLRLRDRAIMEVLYSTGIRRAELIHLNRLDLDRERGVLAIWQGKGQQDRMVPIGERAIDWIDRYLDEARADYVLSQDDDTLFLNKNGIPVNKKSLSRRVGEYIDKARIGKRGACHLFRHSFANLMLENGAEIRYIQEILGHASIRTTQIYTQVSIQKLRQVHGQMHPGERARKKKK